MKNKKQYFKSYRKSIGLSQSDIAFLFNKSNTYICKIEKNILPPDSITLVCSSILFNKEVKDIFPDLSVEYKQGIVAKLLHLMSYLETKKDKDSELKLLSLEKIAKQISSS